VPLLDDPLIEFIGEIDESQKGDFLGRARALLFPIDWPEPFGLVVIEALACGTPIVAFGAGAIPELLEDGVTGYVVHNLEDAVATAGRVHLLDRRACRASFERRFSSARMAKNYVAVYAEAIQRAQRSGRGRRAREAAA
jgi:glycosyltransferase involved in cell wall biosynthesis